jgi:hypothetical protein
MYESHVTTIIVASSRITGTTGKPSMPVNAYAKPKSANE